jgi:hypothetical protein
MDMLYRNALIPFLSLPPQGGRERNHCDPVLLHEKADQAQALLAETGLDCWLTFVRETELHPDPGFEWAGPSVSGLL